MSTEIKASCFTCGEVKLRETGVLLTVMDWGDGSTYTFFCPACREQVTKPADEHIIQLLENVVHVKKIHVPLEIAEGGRSGPLLTTDDLMEFVVELYKDGFIAPDHQPVQPEVRHECALPRLDMK